MLSLYVSPLQAPAVRISAFSVAAQSGVNRSLVAVTVTFGTARESLQFTESLH